MSLQISDTLSLPLDYVTKTAAILAQRRKGKTYTAAVIAEELVRASQPWAALDPTGAWYGLRSSSDGESPGLPVVILGGQHGDAPLERTAGRYVAELVVENPGWYVLDLSLLESRAAEREFATDFGEGLLRRKRQRGRDFPMHLFVDEADMFAPQERETGDQRMLGAYQAIVRRGGLAGLGSTLISQRPALLNKSVLTQLDILFILRLVAGQDQDAVDKNYLSRAGSPAQRAALMASAASLALGEAWVWEPGAEPPLFERLRIRERRTFNSSATPKPGEQRIEPSRLADVDLDAVKEAMAAAIDRAKADDPKELRRRIAELERALHTAQRAVPTVEQVEVPVLDADLVIRLEELLQPAAALLGEVQEHLRWRVEDNEDDTMSFTRVLAGRSVHAHTPVNQGAALRRKASDEAEADPPAAPTFTIDPELVDVLTGKSDGSPAKLGKAERLILTALAEHPQGRSREQLAFLSGYHPRSKGFTNALSSVRAAGYVAVGARWAITNAGRAALGPYDPPGDPIDYWMGRLGLAERGALRAVLDVYPNVLTNAEVAARTLSSASEPYHPRSKGFTNAVSRLRSLGLVEGPRGFLGASEELFG